MSRHRHRRWGRDALTGGKQHSVLAAVGGFLLVPTGVGLLSGLAASALKQTTPQQVATTYAIGHSAGLALSWYGAKKYPALHSFLRGGMWGEGIVDALAVSGAASIVAIPTQVPGQPATTTVSLTSTAPSTQQQLAELASKVVSGNLFKKAA